MIVFLVEVQKSLATNLEWRESWPVKVSERSLSLIAIDAKNEGKRGEIIWRTELGHSCNTVGIRFTKQIIFTKWWILLNKVTQVLNENSSIKWLLSSNSNTYFISLFLTVILYFRQATYDF